MSNSNITYIVEPGGTVVGSLRVPGDKSISHRSIILGSIANGTTRVSGFLEGEDCLATMAAFRAMGVDIERPGANKLIIHGVGLHGLQKPANEIDLGNSGTAMRLLSGLMAGQAFDSVLSGDSSLSSRPMNRVIKPLARMGATIQSESGGRPPLQIAQKQSLHGINYLMPVASAQVKSAILLAGLYAEGTTTVIEPGPTRDHTERMLGGFGYDVMVNEAEISLQGGGELIAADIDVPADISSAAFFMVAASIASNASVTLQHVGINPTRTGVIDILRLMGASISLDNEKDIGGETVADIHIKSANLVGIDIPEELVPLAIDEFPVLFIAAASATGKTCLTGAEELRVKESDRIQVMIDGLKICGIECEATTDGAIIHGGKISGGTINSHGDHRIAMAFSVAGLVAEELITIKQCANVDTSFPGFVDLAASAGIQVRVSQ